jgi:membrane protein
LDNKNLSISSVLRAVYALLKRLFDPELVYYASSLSFYTVFNIIPLLIIVLTIITHLPSFDKFYVQIKSFIIEHILPSHQEAVGNYLDMFLENSMQIGIMGFVYVVVASIMFFQNYEYIVNRIFHSKPRKFWNSLTVYWTMITLMPMILFSSLYFSVNIYSMLEAKNYSFSVYLIDIFPYLITWLIFFVTYRISITVDMQNKLILLASFITSIVWESAKTLFIYYVLYNKTYLSIYGSFSILLFFFLWIYLSWIIFLYGLKLSYVFKILSSVSKKKEIIILKRIEGGQIK